HRTDGASYTNKVMEGYHSIAREVEGGKFYDVSAHDYATETVIDPTCTEVGYTLHTCVCGDSYEDSEVAALGHKEEVDAAVAPSCSATGLTEGKHCSVCGEVLVAQEVVAKLAHTASDWKILEDATCTTAGLKYKDCTVCGADLEEETIEAKGHTPSGWIIYEDATCTEEGMKYTECTVCEAQLDVDIIEAKGHTPSGWIIDEDATCTKEGLKYTECTVCKAQLDVDIIEAKGHTVVVDAAVAPTCTETGLTEGSHCSVCNTVLVAQEVVNATGHTEVIDAAVAATCTTDGKTEGKHCSVCNTVLVAQQVVEAPGHSFDEETHICDCGAKDPTVCFHEGTVDKTEAKAATCTTAGNTDYWTCSGCNNIFLDEDCKTLSMNNAHILAPLGHAWVDADCDTPKTCSVCSATEGEALGHTWNAATCTAPKTCKVCGATEGEALGHAWVDADCDTPKTCSVCGATEGEALGHNWNDATCTAPKTCSVCEATEGEALGHTWVDADCDTPKTCSACGATEGEALGHDIVVDAAVEATCTETGLTAGSHCPVCGTVLVAQEVVPA
ncbi:MAG: hypothetical protein IJX70_05365, partial [Clostridia bacterium]|nr:hypothetical protein [Clostridia bacterium]